MKSVEGGALSALTFNYEPYFPFTIYHASAKSNRRYTLFASSEKIREKWKMAFRDALTVRRVLQESNMVCCFYLMMDTVLMRDDLGVL